MELALPSEKLAKILYEVINVDEELNAQIVKRELDYKGNIFIM